MFLLIFSMSSVIAMADSTPTNVINVNGCCQNSCQTACKPKVVTKVVEKIVEKRVEVPVVVEREVEVPVEVVKTVTKRVYKKNHLSLLGGYGPTRLYQYSNERTDLLREPVGGLMYQRSLTETWEIGIQGQTNQTVLGVITYDY